MMRTQLNEILAYEHPAVVRRFKKEFPDQSHRAEQLLSDLLRFFWASKKHSLDRAQAPTNDALNFVFIMDEEMLDMDRMWHVFLLYTQDYMDFCEKYFGEYLHHLPDIVPTLEPGSFEFAANLEKFLSYVYDELGAEVVERWFAASCAAE